MSMAKSYRSYGIQTTRMPTLLLPLYVYPSSEAWKPLYELYVYPFPNSITKPDHASAADHRRASTYPHVHFTAVINPNSGPGEGPLPNEDYRQAIRMLNSKDNVRTIGYVATTWCQRDLKSVLDEIARYAEWGNSDSSLAMSGIFFDETPTRYAPEYVSFLQTVSLDVRSHRGLKDGFVGKGNFLIPGLGVLHALCPMPEAGGSRYMATPLYIACTSSAILWFCCHRIRKQGQL
jgi:hypothetical protein